LKSVYKTKEVLQAAKIVKFQTNIKALGITITNNLSWEIHANNMIKKAKKMISVLKFVRTYLTEEQFLRSVTNNLFSTVFYANSVWYDSLKANTKSKFNAIY